jgi:hypothetical protein
MTMEAIPKQDEEILNMIINLTEDEKTKTSVLVPEQKDDKNEVTRK